MKELDHHQSLRENLDKMGFSLANLLVFYWVKVIGVLRIPTKITKYGPHFLNILLCLPLLSK